MKTVEYNAKNEMTNAARAAVLSTAITINYNFRTLGVITEVTFMSRQCITTITTIKNNLCKTIQVFIYYLFGHCCYFVAV